MARSGNYLAKGRSRRDKEERLQKQEIQDAKKNYLYDPFSPDEKPILDIKDGEVFIPDDKRKWYVLDTNLILSCVNVIYDADDPHWRPPLNFRPSLDNANLIIPEKVFEELNHIKDGHTTNRQIASVALRRIAKFTENSERALEEIMLLRKPIRTGWKNQTITVLPLFDGFKESLPRVPEENDNDGWIAVAALVATMIRSGQPVDGTLPKLEILRHSNTRRDVVLLTNDNALRSKADWYGVRSKPYSFDQRPAFTGMRELTVPAEMFAKFYHEEKLTREEFETYLPSEEALVANEYIVMTPEGDVYPRGYFADDATFENIARYHKENDLLLPLRHIRKEGRVPPNSGIATYYDAMNDDKIDVIVVTGKAGTGKTFQIVSHAIRALRNGQFAKVILIVSSDNGVGYLPGNQKKKLEPMVAFCKDAICSYLAQTPEFRKKRELLRKFGDIDEVSGDDERSYEDNGKRRSKKSRAGSKHDDSLVLTDKLPSGSHKTYYEFLEEQTDYIYDRYFEAIPFKQAQGRSFEDAIVVVDEAQRIIIDEMETFITRRARNSLLVVCGDVNQIKYNSPEKRLKNGLIFTRKIYYDWEGCANIHLTDNMRHEAADVANRNYDKVIEELGELNV